MCWGMCGFIFEGGYFYRNPLLIDDFKMNQQIRGRKIKFIRIYARFAVH